MGEENRGGKAVMRGIERVQKRCSGCTLHTGKIKTVFNIRTHCLTRYTHVYKDKQ